MSRPRDATDTLVRVCILLAFFLVVGLNFCAKVAFGEEYHSNPWLKTWIPAECCVTKDCCWEIQESELRPLPNDHWEIRSTGQVLKRTGSAPDGKFYRCACSSDRNTPSGWVRHQGSHTFCIFIPLRGA